MAAGGDGRRRSGPVARGSLARREAGRAAGRAARRGARAVDRRQSLGLAVGMRQHDRGAVRRSAVWGRGQARPSGTGIGLGGQGVRDDGRRASGVCDWAEGSLVGPLCRFGLQIQKY